MQHRPKPNPPAAPLPDFIRPALATLVDKAPTGDGWIHEVKLAGSRTAARIETGEVQIPTRSGLDWTARFQPIAEALAVPKTRAAYLDGEIAVLGEDGVTSFAALQDALSRGQAQRLTYHVFDLLHLDGRDLTRLPLIERKALLAPLLARLPNGSPVRYSDHVEGQGSAFFAQACKRQLEGIVSKRAAAPYRSRRRLFLVERQAHSLVEQRPVGVLPAKESDGRIQPSSDILLPGANEYERRIDALGFCEFDGGSNVHVRRRAERCRPCRGCPCALAPAGAMEYRGHRLLKLLHYSEGHKLGDLEGNAV